MTSWTDAKRLPDLLAIPAATERLKQIGADDIGRLVNHVNGKAFSDFLKQLPRIQGFNRGTEGEKQRQKREIVRAAISGVPGPNEPYWDGYCYAWFSATVQRVGAAWPFKFDDAQLRGKDAAVTVAIALSQRSGDASLQPIARETLAEILAFSPLEIDIAAKAIVAQSRPAADIERDAILEAVPKHLADLSTLIERHDAELKQIQQLRADASFALDRRFESFMQQVNEKHGDAVKALVEIKEQLSSAIASAHTLEDLLPALDNRVRALEARDAVEPAQLELAGLRQLIEALTAETYELKRTVLSGSISQATTGTAVPSVSRISEENRAADALAPRYALKQIKQVNEDDVAADLTAWADVYAALQKELEYLSLSKADARSYAIAIAAAFRARQIPILGGSLAHALAFLLCLRIVGGPILLADIPLGCRLPLDMQYIHGRDPRVLLISGLSRAPFEIFGGDVRTTVLRTQMGWPSRAPRAALASFEAGPAALPLSAPILELGPYLDLDAATWGKRSRPNPTRSQIVVPLLESRRSDAPTNQSLLNDLEQDVAEMGIVGSAAWRASMHRFFTALSRTAKEGSATTDLDPQQLADIMYRCWIVPMLSVEEQDTAKRAERLAKISTAVSSKITNLLNAPVLRPW